MFDTQTLLTRFGTALGLIGGNNQPQSIAKALGYLKQAGNPIGAVVPDHVGQIYQDTLTNQFWISYGVGFMQWLNIADTVQDGIVAFAGGGQASATQLSFLNSRIATVATIADSAKLLLSAPSLAMTVTNAAANSANIFPAVGDQINTLGANAAFALAGGKTVLFISYTAGQWHTLLSA